MKLGSADFPKLKFSLLLAVLMIAGGAGAVYVAFNLSKSSKIHLSAAQSERNDIAGKLQRVRSEEDEIKQKSALFHNLKTRGVIGEEQRLEWVELLKDIRDQRRLLDLKYEIAPQRSLDADPGNGYAFFSSTMNLQLKLLHEEDLTRLLNDLRQRAKALIQIKKCGVARLPRGSNENGIPAQLQAECQINWITLHEVESKPVNGSTR
ncbi:hypothetical protein [Propionivibrio sp.]|uniref:hypothetical protein n=1 Tax=Propionivibrio sp. TaxID=2212460 RepID=UPI0026209BC8|nr:hypothetical protein [Propionivibrio sp.]